MSEVMEFTSRYGDGPLPNPETVCMGQCEGMGCYPHRPNLDRSETRYERDEWERKHASGHGWLAFFRIWWATRSVGWSPAWPWKQAFHCDGWHFINCPDCKGTGVRPLIGKLGGV